MRCRSRDRHGYSRHQREWWKRGRNVDGAGVAGASDQLGVVPDLLEPVRVTGVDLDPTTAQDRARTRKQVLAIGGAIILAVVVIAELRGRHFGRVSPAGRRCWSCWVVSQVALRWLGGPSVMGAPSGGSEADLRRYFRPWIELRFADGSAIALPLGRSART